MTSEIDLTELLKIKRELEQKRASLSEAERPFATLIIEMIDAVREGRGDPTSLHDRIRKAIRARSRVTGK